MTRSITVQEAINTGLKRVAQPSANLFIAGITLCVLLLIFAPSWWDLLLIPAGMLSSVFYSNHAAENWQIWAYDNVADIHQLQRSAELAGLLAKGSHESTGDSGASKKETLSKLQERFMDEAVFIDDPSIAGRTAIFFANSRRDEPVLALNSAGIWTAAEGFFDWGQISNERIPQLSYSSRGYRGRSRGSEYVFRFDHRNGCFEIPLSSLRIKLWELDLLLYIYRGRFATARIPVKVN